MKAILQPRAADGADIARLRREVATARELARLDDQRQADAAAADDLLSDARRFGPIVTLLFVVSFVASGIGRPAIGIIGAYMCLRTFWRLVRLARRMADDRREVQ